MYLYHVCQQENTFKLNRNKNKTWKFKQLRTWTTVFKGHGIHHKVQHKKQSPQWTKWSTVNSSQNSSVRTKPDPLPPPFPHALLPAWTHSRKYGMNQRLKKKKKRKGGTIHLFILLSFLRSNKAASKTILSNSGKPQSHKEKGAVRGAIKQCCWRCPPAYTLQSVSFWVLLAGHSYPSGLSVPGVISRTVTSLFGGGNTSFRKPTKILTLLESVGQDFTSLSNKSHVRILGRCLVSSLRSCSCYVGLPGGRS